MAFEKVKDKPRRGLNFPTSQNNVKKLIGDFERKVADVSNFVHLPTKNPQKNALKSDKVLKLKTPSRRKYSSPKKEKLSDRKRKIIVKNMNHDHQNPILKFALTEKDRQKDIRQFFTGPE